MRVVRAFGDEQIQEATEGDEIASIAFDQDGDRLAVGDRAGRVVVFSGGRSGGAALRFAYETHAHDVELDTMRSENVSSTVTSVRWCPWGLLTSNERTVKLWAVGRGRGIRLRRAFDRAHRYPIHSVSPNSDGQTFLSADDLRINVWPVDAPKPLAFTVLDLKPDRFDDLDEVVTRAAFHPRACHELMWATSRGGLSVADLRAGPMVKMTAVKLFGGSIRRRSSSASSFDRYDEIAGAVTDACYVGSSGHCVVARDYVGLTLWDTRAEGRPVAQWPVHRALRPHFDELHKADALYDRFQCAASGDGARIVTGTYADSVFVMDANNPSAEETVVRASRTPATHTPRGTKAARLDVSALDRRVLYVSYHPTRRTMAAATRHAVFLFDE